MKKLNDDRISERGSAAVKFLLIFIVLVLVANAGFNYIPVAYNGASFRQEMDTAVVKALGSSGRIKPMDVVTASVRKASADHNIPEDAFVEIKPVNGVVEAHVIYTEKVNMLPFGLYKYDYNFDYVARPVGYLLKE
jgi:hypothetical protein